MGPARPGGTIRLGLGVRVLPVGQPEGLSQALVTGATPGSGVTATLRAPGPASEHAKSPVDSESDEIRRGGELILTETPARPRRFAVVVEPRNAPAVTPAHIRVDM